MSEITLSGYDVIEQIGSGAYSMVFHVRCRKTGKSYAAKRLIDCCTDMNDEVVFAEVHLMRSIPRHPNISSVCNYVLENDSMTLIMELMAMNLYQYMERRSRPFSESRAQKMLYQIVQALEYLHANGIFHRDVKPENILVKVVSGLMGKKEILQLADFGSAARISDRPPFTAYIATRWYRAPECMLSMGYYGPKMDVWAVGCCFYELITLKPLFQGENELEMLDAIHSLHGSPSPLTLEKFRPLNPLNLDFRKRKPVELRQHLPLMHAFGIDLLKRMIAYCPDQRICAKKMAQHMYFEELWYGIGSVLICLFDPDDCNIWRDVLDLGLCRKHKKVSKFSLSNQTLQLISNDVPIPANGRSVSRSSTNNHKAKKLFPVRKMTSQESIQSNNTFHHVSIEEQNNLRFRRRMWNMNPAALEMRNSTLETRRKYPQVLECSKE